MLFVFGPLSLFSALAWAGEIWFSGMALLDSSMNVISFGFYVLMEVRLYVYSLQVCFLETSCPADWAMGIAALCVQTVEYGDRYRLVFICFLLWSGFLTSQPKGQSDGEKGYVEFMFQEVNNFSWGGDSRDREVLWHLWEWLWVGKHGHFLSSCCYSSAP